MATTLEADVVIVGAGLSGMIATRTVLAAGLVPVVLEADERVGGRILIEDVLRENAFHARFASELAELEVVLRRLDDLAADVPVEAPWLAPRADEWDVISAGTWYDNQRLSPIARTLLEICTVGILAVPTVEVSFLHLLFTIQTCGVTSELFAESEGGAQTSRFVGGTSKIPRRLAALITDQIVLEAPVQTIEHSAVAASSSPSRRPSPVGSCTTLRCPGFAISSRNGCPMARP